MTAFAVLKDGSCSRSARSRDLYEKPNNVFVAGFIGSPANEPPAGRRGRGRHPLRLAQPPDRPRTRCRTPAPVRSPSAIRPEDVVVVDLGRGSAGHGRRGRGARRRRLPLRSRRRERPARRHRRQCSTAVRNPSIGDTSSSRRRSRATSTPSTPSRASASTTRPSPASDDDRAGQEARASCTAPPVCQTNPHQQEPTCPTPCPSRCHRRSRPARPAWDLPLEELDGRRHRGAAEGNPRHLVRFVH